MELGSLTSSSAVAQTNVQTNSVISSDFETFLKMLTAQARYQDPLEPIDSSEYAAQLAQFSMVEQQVKANDLLTALGAQIGSDTLGQAVNWIGMEALSTAPVYFDGDAIEVRPNPAAVADQVFLIARNASGKEVSRIELPVSAEPYFWDGLDADGDPLPAGNYIFDIESVKEGEVILTDPAQSYARVTEARLQDGQPVLILEGGSAILATDIGSLREPSA